MRLRSGRVPAAHIVTMTLLLLDRSDLDLDYALREETTPDLLNWVSLTSSGKCTWVEAAQMVTLVGVDPAFTFLILSRDEPIETSHRFCQTTGGLHGGLLLVEIGEGDNVGIVAPWDARFGRQIPVTESSPWEFSTADEFVLLPRGAVIPITFDWLVHIELSSKYRLRPVEDFSLPTPA